MSNALSELRAMLSSCEPGDVPDPRAIRLDSALANCWDQFEGSDATGMTGDRLTDRDMESVEWAPPTLRFVIERHGGKKLGSTRFELYHWVVDVEKMTATIEKKGHLQATPQAKRISIKPRAQEVADLILAGVDSQYLNWETPFRVRVLVGKVFPKKDTRKTRSRDSQRGRLGRYIEEMVSSHGWRRLGSSLFAKDESS